MVGIIYIMHRIKGKCPEAFFTSEIKGYGFPVFSGVPHILNNGTIYNLGQLSGDTDLSMMEFNGTNAMVQTCEIWFSTGAETYNVIWPSDTFWIDSATGAPPELYYHRNYRMVLRKEINKIVANVAYYYPVIS